jgi:galactose-inhibitable lectin light subunit
MVINVYTKFVIFLVFYVNAADFNIQFTSKYDSYQIQNHPEANVFKDLNQLFDREKCKTCCRVSFVSNYNFDAKRGFTKDDDNRSYRRFAMDMEFDDKRSVRLAEGEYEQCILLRPLNKNNELQWFELNAYKMINSFPIPKRVHDIRSGIKKNNKLIIWKKKPPLNTGTNNQRFVYTYPYGKNYYNINNDIYINYPKHFYAPFYTTEPVCYEAVTNSYQRWTGNKMLTVIDDNYQIQINECKDDPKQEFIPIFI